MKKIFAITVNYARAESTNRLIESFDRSDATGFIFEIIVVDNSPDKNFELARKFKNKTTILRPGVNTGFSKGNNIGIKEALKKGADYVLLINDDTTVFPDMLKNLKESMDDNEKIGIVSPKIYFAKGHEFHKDRYKSEDLGHIIWYAGGFTDWANATSVHRGVDEVDSNQYERKEKIDFATGCCLMVRKEVFEKIGFFDERYFLYYEDHDFCERVKKAGFDIYYVPKSVMYHENASSSGGPGNDLHDYFLTRNQMIFGMKYAPFRTKLALVKQSLRLLTTGRKYQKKGVIDYYLRRFGKGTYFN